MNSFSASIDQMSITIINLIFCMPPLSLYINLSLHIVNKAKFFKVYITLQLNAVAVECCLSSRFGRILLPNKSHSFSMGFKSSDYVLGGSL